MLVKMLITTNTKTTKVTTISSTHTATKQTHSAYGATQRNYMNFFFCHYNPLWVLAFSLILFHSALSSHRILHRFAPIICIFSSMFAIHLFRGLPLILVPIGFHCNIFLGVLLSILIT